MPCRAAGFTLIEVLIALLITAIGMVCAAGAQFASARMRHESMLMTMAVKLGSNAGERILNNSRLEHLYMGFDYDSERDGQPAGYQDCFTTTCSGEELAAFDLGYLRNMVRTAFPGGRIVICRDFLPPIKAKLVWECNGNAHSPIAIKIGWRERGPLPAHQGVPAMNMVYEGVPP